MFSPNSPLPSLIGFSASLSAEYKTIKMIFIYSLFEYVIPAIYPTFRTIFLFFLEKIGIFSWAFSENLVLWFNEGVIKQNIKK